MELGFLFFLTAATLANLLLIWFILRTLNEILERDVVEYSDNSYESQTLGELLDKLTIVNIKIYWCVEILLKCDGPSDLIAQAGKKAQTLNDQRSKLKNLIDEFYGIDVDRLEVKTTTP